MDLYSRKGLPRSGFILLHLFIAAIFLFVLFFAGTKKNALKGKVGAPARSSNWITISR